MRPTRRLRHLIFDAVLAAWVLAWGLVGWSLKLIVDALASPVQGMANTTSSLAERVDAAADGLAQVALVGEELASPFRPIADILRNLTGQANEQVETISSIGWMLFLVIWLIPSLSVALVYLPGRFRRGRESALARQFVDARADLDLFALRAMVNAPMTQLAAISDDPVAAWRSGDKAVIDQLAELELKRVGIGILKDPDGH